MIKHTNPIKIMRRGEVGFEKALLETVFNKRVTTGEPDILFAARTVEDIQEAILLARQENRHMTICSGGSSWSTNHMRDGCLVLDMSHFDAFAVDKSSMTATAGPGCGGYELLIALTRQGLFFPGGHCKGVCLGGYLLQGGFGWHGQHLGLACEHVIGLDIVTSDGEVVHASETENADLFWAARGAGAGFFGVVFRFHLRIFPKPKFMGIKLQAFTTDHLEEVLTWAHDILPEIDRNVEFQLFLARRPYRFGQITVEASATVFAESRAKASESVAFMSNSPLKHKARIRLPLLQVNMKMLYWLGALHFKANQRWGVDNMWTHASAEELLPGIRQALDTLPPGHSHIFWHYWNPKPQRPDFAFSMEDKLYLGMYGTWEHAHDDVRYGAWATEHMKALEPYSIGIQLADENLNNRTAPFMKNTHMKRLRDIRQTWDSRELFHRWHSHVPVDDEL